MEKHDRMWSCLRRLPNMEGTSVNCSCSYEVCGWRPCIRTWDQPQGTEAGSNSLGFLRGHCTWGREEALSVASGPTASLSENPQSPIRGNRRVCLGWLPTLDSSCFLIPILLPPFQNLFKSQEETGKSSPLVWEKPQENFENPRWAKTWGLGQRYFFNEGELFFFFFFKSSHIFLKAGCENSSHSNQD